MPDRPRAAPDTPARATNVSEPSDWEFLTMAHTLRAGASAARRRRSDRRRSSLEPLEVRMLLANVPAGFTDAHVAGGLNSPTSMALAPDGRIFVAQQHGQIRVIKNGQLLSTPFATVTVNSQNERGLGGIVLDPDFASNGYVYVYYTATTPILHNRVARFTAAGDVAAANSHTTILDLPDLIGAINHMGGAMHFGADGKLYVAVGNHDLIDAGPQQSIDNVYGKFLRINKDGSIPSDNPFYNQTSGINRAIYAYGLRNPFTFAIQPGTGRIFINDVGQNTWEEVNEGRPGANYGWPLSEGPTNDPRFDAPFYAYRTNEGCAITGGSFYNPPVGQFPASYVGKYFFSDLCGGWIRVLDTGTQQATTFATGASQPVDIDVAADGTMYYLQRGNGSVRRITYENTAAPAITNHPNSVTVLTGEPATFNVEATGAAPLSFQWQRKNSGSSTFDDISGANEASYTISQTQPSDNGAQFRAVVSNSAGTATSNAATLTVETTAGSYLSDLDPTFATNGHGPYERDRSNGEAGANDGGPITLNGVVYPKGLGVHAYSELRYTLGGQYARFLSDVGVDDEVGASGSVVFQVFADNVKIYDSGTMTGASATKQVDVSVGGKSELKLIVTDAGNGNGFDHADWAGARLVRPSLEIVDASFAFATAPHRLVKQFSANVAASLSVSDLVLTNRTTGQTVPASAMSLTYDSSTHTATWTFPGFASGVLPDGRYRATISAGSVEDPTGGTMADDHHFDFLFLRADPNNDGKVGLLDFNVLAANFGKTNRDFTQGDFNYDTVVNLHDFNLLAQLFGTELPLV